MTSPSVWNTDYEIVYIYALFAPDTNQVFYVGQSCQPETRYKQHLYFGRCLYQSCEDRYGAYVHGRLRNRRHWVADLLSKSLNPGLYILEKCYNRASAWKREFYWVRHFLWGGHPLTNHERDVCSWREVEMLKTAGYLPRN